MRFAASKTEFLEISGLCHAVDCARPGLWPDRLPAGGLLLWNGNIRMVFHHLYKFTVCTQRCAACTDADFFECFRLRSFYPAVCYFPEKQSSRDDKRAVFDDLRRRRFIIEFFRGDLIRGSVGALSTSQFISIFIVLFGAVLLWKKLRDSKKSSEQDV